mmetsp:Transcript_18754/g.40692  ORF Transcript_18754/g.40692 Transcript_18754/m.40692 type:complete len:213 (-) Transcript_18754:41-679(-)
MRAISWGGSHTAEKFPPVPPVEATVSVSDVLQNCGRYSATSSYAERCRGPPNITPRTNSCPAKLAPNVRLRLASADTWVQVLKGVGEKTRWLERSLRDTRAWFAKIDVPWAGMSKLPRCRSIWVSPAATTSMTNSESAPFQVTVTLLPELEELELELRVRLRVRAPCSWKLGRLTVITSPQSNTVSASKCSRRSEIEAGRGEVRAREAVRRP